MDPEISRLLSGDLETLDLLVKDLTHPNIEETNTNT